jgi:MFS family permease
MKLGPRIKTEFSFIQGNYKILFISWILMDIAWEMPNPNFQYYVEALGGTEVSLGIIGLASFLGMAIVAFPGGYLADKHVFRYCTIVSFLCLCSNLGIHLIRNNSK